MKRDDSIGRVPPHSIEAEMSVLGACLLGDADAIQKAMEIVSRADFYRDAHCLIFDAIFLPTRWEEPGDVITRQAEMTRAATLDGIGMEYLLQLSDVEFTTSTIAYYAAIVRDKSQKRQLIEAASRIAALAYADEEDAPELIRRAEKSISEIDALSTESKSVTLYEGMSDALLSIRADMQANREPGLQIGLEAVDGITSGLRRGELTVVAGRPGMGKTIYGMHSAYNAGLVGAVTVVFSLEMSLDQLCRRWYASLAQVNGQRIRKNNLTAYDLAVMEEAKERCNGLPVEIIDTNKITAAQMETECRRMKIKHGSIDLVLVDYLLLMGKDSTLSLRSDERQQVVANTRSMKQLARQFNCPVMLITQVSRKVEQREDKRPMLSDLAESGAIEAEADNVLFLYRPAYYEQSDERRDDTHFDECEVIVAKQRNGPTGTVPIAFYPSYTAFDNLKVSQF